MEPERRLGGGDQGRAGRLPIGRVLRQCRAEWFVHGGGQRGVARACARRLLLEVRPGHRQARVVPERRLSREALVQQAGQRVQVRAAVDRLAFQLLGCEVGGRAERAPVQQRATLVDEAAGEAEVCDVHVLAGVEQHVGRLHVAVDEAARVRRVERPRDLRADPDGPCRVERPFAAQQHRQIAPLDVAHGQVQAAVDVARVVDRDGVRVLERRCQLALAQEPLTKALVEGQLGGDELDRHRPLQPAVVRPVDDSHPALADQLFQPVAEELGPAVEFCLAAHDLPSTILPFLRQATARAEERLSAH